MPTEVNRIRNRKGMPPAKLSARERGVFRWAAAIFLAIIADGALRKWVLPSSAQAIPYFAKDVLAGLFVLRYPQLKQARLAKRLMPFVFGIGLCLAPAFLVGLTKVPIGAVVVFKNAVLWPLFAVRMGSYLTEGVTERLWKLALVCTVPMAVLASIQYFAGPSSILNRYAWDETTFGVAATGDLVRATGTFSYIAGLSSFSIVMFCLFLGRSLSARGGAELWLATLGLASAVVCGIVSESRGIQVFMAAVSVAAVVLIPKKQSVRLIGGLLGAAFAFALVWNSSLSQGVSERWMKTDNEEVAGRLTGSSTGQPIASTLSANPIGSGLGLYVGVSASTRSTADLDYNESAANRIAAEAGLPGFLATLLGLGLVISAGRATLLSGDSTRKSRLLPIAVGALIQLVFGTWYDHTAAGLWWWTISLWLEDGVAFGHARRILAKPAPQFVAIAVRKA